MALMDVAKRYAEGRPGAGPASFAEAIGSQEVPQDTLAPRPAGPAGVTLATAQGAGGGQWDLVAVVGVQEGVWPDLRLRNPLGGANRLADLVDGRGDTGDPLEARRAALDDELRVFALACSRARRWLTVTAVAGEEERPSEFCSLPAGEIPRAEDGHPLLTRAPLPLDLRGLVAQARAQATSGDDDAARLLAALADRAVVGADPAWWSGLAPPSSTAPLRPPARPVRLSPSRVETLARCPLRWALEAVGAGRGRSLEQTVGTIIHRLAETIPSADPAVMEAAFDEAWAAIGLPDTWVNRRECRRGRDMAAQLAAYNAAHGPPLAVEASFTVAAEGVELRGKIDRIERAGADVEGVRVVDFKTGKQAVSVRDAAVNPQLGAYQFAVDAGGLDQELGAGARSQGAALVYLGQPTRDGVTSRNQPPPDPDDGWFRPLLAACARNAAAASFAALIGPVCGGCPVRGCCPAHELGEQVTA
jgi:RecB family exonuclease